jgi:hypothetical protein
MKHLFTILFLITNLSLYTQNKQSFQVQDNYNIPPNAIIKPKAINSSDYFSKIDNQPDYSRVSNVESDFKKFLSEDNLKDMELNDKESYSYYLEVLKYFDTLSPKVKALFTADDLWNIYMFHNELKNELLNIK